MRRTLTAAALLLAATACSPVDEPGGIATPPPPAAGNPAATIQPAAPTTAPAAPTGPATTAPGPPSGEHTIVYRVGGTATSASSVSYITGDGQEQQTGVHLPWKRSLKVKGFASASLSAQNAGGGSITCSIDVDGKQVKRSVSSGSYAVVSCVATIGF